MGLYPVKSHFSSYKSEFVYWKNEKVGQKNEKESQKNEIVSILRIFQTRHWGFSDVSHSDYRTNSFWLS